MAAEASRVRWRPRVLRDRASWAIALFFVFLVAVFWSVTRVVMLPDGHLETYSPNVISGDEPHYLLVVNSILFDHDLELQDDYQRAMWGLDAGGIQLPDHHTILVNRRTGQHGLWFEDRFDPGLQPGPDVYEVSAHPVAFPAMVAALIAPFHPTMDEVQGDASLVMVLVCWLGAIFTYLLSRRLGMGRGAALLATALLAFASPWLAYTRSFYSEPVAGVAGLIALWALEGDRPATSALAASAAAFFKPPFAVIGLGLLIDRIEQKRWRDLLVLFSVLSVCGIALIAFNYWLARTPIISGNQAGPWPFGPDTAPDFSRLSDTFLGSQHGLFVWVPWTIFAIFPIGQAFCSPGVRPRFIREMSFPMALQVVVLTGFIGRPGTCYGPRYWVPFLPWMGVAAVETLRKSRWVSRATFAILALVSLAFSIVGALRYPQMFSRSPWRLWPN